MKIVKKQLFEVSVGGAFFHVAANTIQQALWLAESYYSTTVRDIKTSTTSTVLVDVEENS